MLFGMMTPEASDTLRDEPYPGSTMLVLTNNVQLNGAAALFYPGVMDQAAERLGGDFIVLPSSTHEVIMIPADGMTDFRSLEQMVKDINRSQVAPEERLSDHVYPQCKNPHLLFCIGFIRRSVSPECPTYPRFQFINLITL